MQRAVGGYGYTTIGRAAAVATQHVASEVAAADDLALR